VGNFLVEGAKKAAVAKIIIIVIVIDKINALLVCTV